MASKPNIAVVPRTFPEVSQTFVLDHLTGLIDRGYGVSVFADRSAATAPLHAEVEGYGLMQRFQPWPPAGGNPLWRLARLAAALPRLPPLAALKALTAPSHPLVGRGGGLLLCGAQLNRAGPFDIVHAHFGRQGERMAWLIRHGIVQARLVVSLHGFDVNRPLAQGQRPYPLMFALARRVLVTTDFMARQAQALGCPPEKIVQLPIGIDLDRFEFAERHWQPGQPLRLLTVARLVPQKGIDHALRALARLAGEGLAFEYTVVGDGPMRAELQSLAATLGVAAQVRFTGALNREAMRPHFAAAHLFLFTPVKVAEGDEEGQGLVVQEAQACGLPVLATRHGGVPEGLLEGRSGVLCEQGSADDLARALRALIAQTAQWPQMGRAGRAHVEAYYSRARHIDGIEQVYADVLRE